MSQKPVSRTEARSKREPDSGSGSRLPKTWNAQSAVGLTDKKVSPPPDGAPVTLLYNVNPAITARYREANALTLQEVVNRLQEVLTTSLVAYIAQASTRSVRNWASGSIQSARLDSIMRLRAALTAMLVLLEAEEPETVANWFVNVNSYLDDLSPATAVREGMLRETMKAARVYAAYA